MPTFSQIGAALALVLAMSARLDLTSAASLPRDYLLIYPKVPFPLGGAATFGFADTDQYPESINVARNVTISLLFPNGTLSEQMTVHGACPIGADGFIAVPWGLNGTGT
jgi:hypothetical protein